MYVIGHATNTFVSLHKCNYATQSYNEFAKVWTDLTLGQRIAEFPACKKSMMYVFLCNCKYLHLPLPENMLHALFTAPFFTEQTG